MPMSAHSTPTENKNKTRKGKGRNKEIMGDGKRQGK